jgi:hypothetical protein
MDGDGLNSESRLGSAPDSGEHVTGRLGVPGVADGGKPVDEALARYRLMADEESNEEFDEELLHCTWMAGSWLGEDNPNQTTYSSRKTG